ncbi:Dor1-domain-containing protein [Hysterangium stoloniferum]|nr:Dor1-domain-containing protein [Hysterangium stoloniferum]
MAETEPPENATLLDMLTSKSDDPKLLSTPQASSYLTYLTSLPLPSLLAEPQALTEETDALTTQLTALCTSEYPTFLSLHATTSALATSLGSFSSSLDSLLAAIPALEAETQRFAGSTQRIQAARRRAALVLEQHDKLLDVLEIPQLIDTCVRHGYYAEAMDLAAHTAALRARLPGARVVGDIAAEAEQAIRLMATQLLVLLRAPAKLPALFRAAGFLRRVGMFAEAELALAFLTGREACLAGVLAGIRPQRADHARYVRRYVDIFREGVYDVVMQYTAIFLDRAASPGGGGGGEGREQEPEQEQEQVAGLYETLRHFLQTYVHSRVMQLSHVLDTAIPQIDDPSVLTSLLTQLTYCATSFARVGLDFRSILERPFTEAVLLNAVRAFESAAREFMAQMDRNAAKSVSRWFVTPALLASLLQTKTAVPDLDPSSPVHIAPAIISSYPLLATYMNSILTALNSLRLLAPVSLYSQLCRALEMSLVKVGRGLCQRIKTIKGDVKKGTEEIQAFEAAGLVYLKCLVPFATRALSEGVFGVKESRKNGSELQDILSKLVSFVETQDVLQDQISGGTA